MEVLVVPPSISSPWAGSVRREPTKPKLPVGGIAGTHGRLPAVVKQRALVGRPPDVRLSWRRLFWADVLRRWSFTLGWCRIRANKERRSSGDFGVAESGLFRCRHREGSFWLEGSLNLFSDDLGDGNVGGTKRGGYNFPELFSDDIVDNFAKLVSADAALFESGDARVGATGAPANRFQWLARTDSARSVFVALATNFLTVAGGLARPPKMSFFTPLTRTRSFLSLVA